jgi:hypothetical protein
VFLCIRKRVGYINEFFYRCVVTKPLTLDDINETATATTAGATEAATTTTNIEEASS